MEILLSFLGSSGVILVFIVIGIILYVKQRNAQQNDVPALDLVDAKKLDDMVASQVERALKPLLSKEGYSQESIEEALTRTSLGAKQFTR